MNYEEKIKKLKALAANNSNAFEVKVATALAEALAEKYQDGELSVIEGASTSVALSTENLHDWQKYLYRVCCDIAGTTMRYNQGNLIIESNAALVQHLYNDLNSKVLGLTANPDNEEGCKGIVTAIVCSMAVDAVVTYKPSTYRGTKKRRKSQAFRKGLQAGLLKVKELQASKVKLIERKKD